MLDVVIFFIVLVLVLLGGGRLSQAVVIDVAVFVDYVVLLLIHDLV